MSTFLASLGRWSYRHPWRVLVGWLVLLAVTGGAVAAFAQGTDDSFSIPGTESEEGLEQLSRTFPQVSGTSAQIVVVAADGDTVDDQPYPDEIGAAVTELTSIDGVIAVSNPYDDTVSGLVSDDRSAAIVQLQFDGQATDVSDATLDELRSLSAGLGEELPGSEVAVGGDLFSTSVPALSIIEAVGVLVALFVLIVTFRAIALAFFPLISALIGVGLAVALIFVSTAFASVSSTTPMLAVMLGLAVGIDYALFILARHQDQVRAGMAPEESAARATGTAGSAVLFAGVTVLIALIGLSFAGIPFLTTMGIAAAVAVAIAVVVAVTLTPALMGFSRGRVIGWRRRAAPTAAPAAAVERRGFASRWAAGVTRHPILVTVAVVVGLGVVAVPAASLRLALPNAGMQPATSEARVSYDLVTEHFGPGFNGPLILTGTIVTSTDPVQLMTDLGDEIAGIPGVAKIALATPNETADTGIVQVIPTTGPDDPATADLVRELRAQHDRLLDEFGVDLQVTGFTAVTIDISDRLGAALLPFGIFVVGLSLILLAIVFRSIWVPLTAALGYLLSVAAAFGVVSAIFEWGWLADVLHVAKVGPVISFMPIILMGVLFGLAMDYQVFLVSRMREDFVHSKSRASERVRAVDAVRSGFSASARVVTAAALIMFSVFAAFIPEGDTSIKPIAVGLAAGIAIDAFLVRMTLIPAVMALLGRHAWWMPRALARRLPHFDIEGEAVERELSLADWPGAADTAAITGESVSLVDERGARAFGDVDLTVQTGRALVVTGDPAASRALLLALAGRLAITDGRLRVAGHLLPERAAWVRSHVGAGLVSASADPLDELREALRGRPAIAVLDGVDALASDGMLDEAAALIRGTATARTLTIVASAADPDTAVRLLAAAGQRDIPVLDLSRTSPTARLVSTP